MRYRRLKRIVSFLASDRALPWIFATFILMIILFGLMYWILTPLDNGVKEGSDIPSEFTFLQGIYFSIVTISSLGYGDLRPVGVSRVLASLEVFLGLLFVGIMIAALTSRRLSHLVSRLFVSDARKRLKDFSNLFNKSEQEFSELLSRFSHIYQIVPGITFQNSNAMEVACYFNSSVHALMTNSMELRDYIRDETEEGNYFDLVPVSAILEVSNAVSESFTVLSQCVISLPTASRPEIFLSILNKANRSSIMSSVEMQRELCQIGIIYGADQKIIQSFEKIESICENISNNFSQTPIEEQPDQFLTISGTPQN